MNYFPLIYFNSKPLHVSSRLPAHHQEVYSVCTAIGIVVRYVDFLLAGSGYGYKLKFFV
jgi:hypothetical protein